MQIIDFIDFNQKIIDLDQDQGYQELYFQFFQRIMGVKLKQLCTKKFHKANFLKQVSSNLNLNTEVFKENIFDHTDNDKVIITSRAFKPLPLF